jgi:hypothetical protein
MMATRTRCPSEVVRAEHRAAVYTHFLDMAPVVKALVVSP